MPITQDAFDLNKLFDQKITDQNRELLFVEVKQKDLIDNIFDPIHDLTKHNSHFFPKRFAILGDFKIGKTELAKYMISKMTKHYQSEICKSTIINSKNAQYKRIEEIDDWIYNQWYSQIRNSDEFTDIVKVVLANFRATMNSEPKETNDKLLIICKVYREFLKQNPNARFIVGFDQANIIQKQDEFTPFYEFWRNFQGHWENPQFFENLPLFIFVIGHKDWIKFAELQNTIGRGVFDKIITYDYWCISEIREMIEKRLKYCLTPSAWDSFLKYFLGDGIVEYLAKKLGTGCTQEYLDRYFGTYLKEFFKNFDYNVHTYPSFFKFCKSFVRDTKYDETYFCEIERLFFVNPALDYMPVFQHLSDNQNQRWFEKFFDCLQIIFRDGSIKTQSREFNNLTTNGLDFDIIQQDFTQTLLKDGAKPNYNPPILSYIGNNLIFNDTFKSCIDAIENQDPVSLLKRFIKSQRIHRNLYDETAHAKLLLRYIDEIYQYARDIAQIFQTWVSKRIKGVVSDPDKLTEILLNPSSNIQRRAYDLSTQFKHQNTDWATFDEIGRDIAQMIVGFQQKIPLNSPILQQLKFTQYNYIKDRLTSPQTSNVAMTENLNQLLKLFYEDVFHFNIILNARVLLIIDGPNSLGQDYKDPLCLEDAIAFAQSFSKDADLQYLTRIDEDFIPHAKISMMGFNLTTHHKDIDKKLNHLIEEKLKSTSPPNIIIIGAKDGDYMDEIMDIRKNHDVWVMLAISSKQGLSKTMEKIFDPDDIKFFPTKKGKSIKIDAHSSSPITIKPNVATKTSKLSDKLETKSLTPLSAGNVEKPTPAKIVKKIDPILDKPIESVSKRSEANPSSVSKPEISLLQTTSKKRLVITFNKPGRNAVFAQHQGKEYRVSMDAKIQPKLEEIWECEIIQEDEMFVKVKLIQRLEKSKIK